MDNQILKDITKISKEVFGDNVVVKELNDTEINDILKQSSIVDSNITDNKLYKFAKEELLELYGKDFEDDFYKGLIADAVLELMEVFCKQGHSGMSAPIVISLFSKLADYKPITPILNTPSQWTEVYNNTLQHKKLSSVFKQNVYEDDNRAYYIDAVVFRNEKGVTFTSRNVFTNDGERVSSAQYIKSFPFKEKTFYIDVIEYKDETPTLVKDKEQLKEVKEYYAGNKI